jgi:hypothetical protein
MKQNKLALVGVLLSLCLLSLTSCSNKVGGGGGTSTKGYGYIQGDVLKF